MLAENKNRKKDSSGNSGRTLPLLRIAAVLAALVSLEEALPFVIQKFQAQNILRNVPQDGPASVLFSQQSTAPAGQHLTTSIVCLLMCAACLAGIHFVKSGKPGRKGP